MDHQLMNEENVVYRQWSTIQQSTLYACMEIS
jgi:hypothetical protein